MAWEYEGLFDAVPETEDNLLAEYWRTEATATRIGSMGYRTRTIKAGTRLEAEVYPIFGRSMEQTARREKQNMTKERQQQLNTKRAKRRLVLLMENNFSYDRDIHVTLTYAGEEPELERCRKDIRNFLNRVKRQREKRGLDELKYIYSVGHDRDQRIHVHCVMNGGISRDELEKMWGKGYANTIRLQKQGGGLQGMANYLYRQNEKARDRGEREGFHMWSGSRNLKKPKEHVSDTKISNRKVKMIAQNFRHISAEVMEKIYPGYCLEDCRVQYSDVVDGVYIRCVMRKSQ
ncbi:MAG: hypothetical protein K6F61_05025 [Clostridiales bacterium]|nr:hypothetical protein [Clostridiales bacterium]